MSLSILRKIYEEYNRYQFQDYVPSQEADAEHPRIAQIVRLAGESGRCLDLGTGRGEFALALKQRGFDVTAVDISQESVEVCRRRGLAAHRVDLESETWPTFGILDVVLFLEIVEHLMDPLPVLRQIRAIVRPGGRLILSTPNAAYVKFRARLLLGRMPDFGENRCVSAEPRPYNLLHKTPLTLPDLRALLRAAGFEATTVEPEEYVGSKLWDWRLLRWARQKMRWLYPSMFAGSVVVVAVPGTEASGARHSR